MNSFNISEVYKKYKDLCKRFGIKSNLNKNSSIEEIKAEISSNTSLYKEFSEKCKDLYERIEE